MTVLLMRHGIAEDRDTAARSGIADAERALTDRGVKRLRRAVAGLGTIQPALDVVATSPLRRARETAAMMADAYPEATLARTDALAPGRPAERVFEWLQDQRGEGRYALVGHEPDLGRWASLALTGAAGDAMPMKKAGAMLLHFDAEPAAGAARLVWALSPAVLRQLGIGR